MDRISKALEQAKKQQATSRKAGWDDNARHEDANKPRVYSKTRRVSLDSRHLQENRILLGIEDGPVVDTFGLLRTRVLKAMRNHGWKTLGVTSPDPSVGKTVTSVNLAISIAMDHNYSVLLVDADLRRPGVSNVLGIQTEQGLDDYLTRDVSLEEVLLNPQVEHMIIAPTKRVTTGTSELLSSPKMTRFVQEAKQRYPERVVIFDLPPVLVGDDVVALSQNLDALLLVVEDGKTPTKELSRTLDLLHDVNILGVVLNKGRGTVKTNYDYYH